MSRISQFEKPASVSPCTKFLTWDNGNKTFKCYDKNDKDKERGAYLLNLPLKLVVVDKFIKITGWNEKDGCKYYSNEIKSTIKEKLIVKDKNGVVVSGMYSDIKDELKRIGAKYSESIYVMLDDGSLANITLVGSNAQVWMDFVKTSGTKAGTEYVGFGNPQTHKKGSITWSTPEIKVLGVLSTEDNDKAEVLYNALYNFKVEAKIRANAEAEITLPQDLATKAMISKALEPDETEDDMPY